MQASQINFVWLSEKRKNLLSYLRDGPKDIEQIKSFFNVTSRLIVPEIKKLVKTGSILESYGMYMLSNIGKLNLENLEDFIDTAELIEKDIDFWENSDLTAIPTDLYQRIGELKNSIIYVYDLDDIFDAPKQLKETVATAKDIMAFMPFLPPTLPTTFLDSMNKGAQVSMVLTKSIMEKMKREFPIEYDQHLTSPNCKMFTCAEDVVGPMIVVMDNFLLLGFFKHNGIYGNKELMSYDKRAIEWGRELYLHYIGISEPVE
jgi:predicted transcriptional regulator